ncbi:hypothetical protein KIW84_023136 [Lathyrus oleraceus]|uniref:Uncharacterized protein n=1 Tax=Pisum sativum TaxID=3888 RepID=A0A9D5B638_PEA|nr:hypothetical protein KIW84_023136 [Pisum sativum]
MTIKVIRHESPCTTLRIRALLPQPLNLPRIINLVKLKNSKLHLPMLVLNLLRLGVGLLLTLLGSTAETENKVEGGFLLDVVVSKSAAVFELFAGEDQSLLVRWDSFLILDLCFDIVDGVRRLDLEGDGFPR